MVRNMDLVREILLTIEKEYIDSDIHNLKIGNYDMKIIAYHCRILYDAGFVTNYYAICSDDELHGFLVGALTWEGHEFLDKIRDDNTWNKTKEVIKGKGLPLVLDTIKQISSAIISEVTKAAIKGLMQN